MVVHGDDFTCLGYEDELTASKSLTVITQFEIISIQEEITLIGSIQLKSGPNRSVQQHSPNYSRNQCALGKGREREHNILRLLAADLFLSERWPNYRRRLESEAEARSLSCHWNKSEH